MANSKISALTSATTPLAGTETLPIVQSSATKQVSVANLTAGRTIAAKGMTATDGGNVGGAGAFIGVAANAGNSAMAGIKGGLANATGSEDQGDLYLQTRPVGAAGQALRTVFIAGVDANTAVPLGNLIFQTAAKGINFTANSAAAGMTSQLLNWYEEGTFTPTYTGSVSNPTVGFSEQYGYYTRIGRMVYFIVRLAVSSLSGGSGDLRVSLPFTTKNTSGGIAGGGNVAFAYQFNTTNPTAIFISPNVAYFTMNATTSSLSFLQVSNLSNPCYLSVSGSFFV